MKKVNIILVGFGRVGKAFFQVVHEKTAFCQERYGLDLRLYSICEIDGALFSPDPLDASHILERFPSLSLMRENPYWKEGLHLRDLLSSIEPGVLVECTPSNIRSGEPGLNHLRQALDGGWHVVTASTGPLVVDFRGLREKAKEHGVKLKFSGATAAALPALDMALYSLAGAEVYRIEGILNGTTNYILTRMKEGMDYKQALEEAQSKGIAEPDPSLDVEGWDTASKILLITNAALDADFTLDDIKVEGITAIPTYLLVQGKEEGKALKLLGRFSKEEKTPLEVSLKVIERSHPLYGVNGADKGITFTTDTMHSVTVTGGKSDPRGAGAALLKDIINIYRKNL
ncbi:MAG: homoserine dehydrogenase [Candidatus Aminicenantes bacterium]|nr:MAG: homoserine dehydrogenase [Candidatus Aminicenantes bacterium]